MTSQEAQNRGSLEITPTKRKLVGLVQRAYEGEICLPNFQRDFVWSREAVADLVRSVLRGYFIGSLLLLQTDAAKPPFAPQFHRGARPKLHEPQPDLLVLDGQQRLTSLIYALTAPDLSLKDSVQRRWFFVDLDTLLADPDSDQIVVDRAQRELRGLLNSETQFAERMLPCTALLTADRFYKWRDDYEDWAREHNPDDYQSYRDVWRSAWVRSVNAFQGYDVAVIELPRVEEGDSDAIGRVCAIFEKLNSTGVELSVYDLLTARLYRSGIRLHDLWNQACADNSLLREWSEGKADKSKFGVLVLRTLALRRGLDPKPRILIDLSPESFAEDWRRAAAAIEKALELLTSVGQDGFGVFDQKWLPGFGLIPILAALRAEIEDRSLGETERGLLRRWYWCNVFLERYSSAVESKSRKDYLEMTRHWLSDGSEPDVFAEAQNWIGAPGFRIRNSASYASAVYSGIFCLLALRGARDWRRGEDILLQALQDHHIFPRAYLRRHETTKSTTVNSVANRTLISDETNRIILDKAPAEYLVDANVFPSGARSELITPHYLAPEAVAAMGAATEALANSDTAEVYERFLSAREMTIIQEIRRVCGVRELPAATPVGEAQEPDQPAADVLQDASTDEEDYAA